MNTIATHSAVTELAAILACGYLRLTQVGRYSDVSRAGDSQKELDVSRRESPHCDHEIRHERPPWRTA